MRGVRKTASQKIVDLRFQNSKMMGLIAGLIKGNQWLINPYIIRPYFLGGGGVALGGVARIPFKNDKIINYPGVTSHQSLAQKNPPVTWRFRQTHVALHHDVSKQLSPLASSSLIDQTSKKLTENKATNKSG